MLRHVFLLLLIGQFTVIFTVSKHKIHIGCLIPSFARDEYGFHAAINLAADMINNRTDILPDHELVMVCGDTYVSTS